MRLLDQILQSGYPSTPIKIESGQGRGELQKAARNITLGKIIFLLCKEGPLTKYQIANMGNIHKSNLGSDQDIITHRLHDLQKLDMIIKHKHTRIPERVTGGIKTKYMFTYYLANWNDPLTRYMFQWYRDQFQPTYFCLTEYEELEDELDGKMRIFEHYEKHDPEVLRMAILQEEIADLYSCAEKIQPIDKKTKQVKEGINIEGMTKCAKKIVELKDKPIEYRDNLIQFLKHANIHKEPISVEEPLKIIRQLLKQEMHKLDYFGHLDNQRNLSQLSKLDNLQSIDNIIAVFDLLVQLKIENRLPDFIAIWKKIVSKAQATKVLVHQVT